MNRKDREIQRTLDRLAKMLLEDGQSRDRPSQTSVSDSGKNVRESDRLTASASPEKSAEKSESVYQQTVVPGVYNELSVQDAKQIQAYLEQLGKPIDSENAQKASSNQPASAAELSQKLVESSIKPAAPQVSRKTGVSSDASVQQSQSIPQSIRVKQPERESSERESKEIETAGILEELLERFAVDPGNPEAIEYEDLLEQLAIDRTDPTTVKELDQLLGRLTDKCIQENSSQSIAEELELETDDLLERSDEHFSQPVTKLEQQVERGETDRLVQESSSQSIAEAEELKLETDDLLERSDEPVSQPATKLEQQVDRGETEPDLSSPLLSDLSFKDSVEPPIKAKMRRRNFWGLSLAIAGLVLVPWGIYQYFQGTEGQVEEKVTKLLESSPDLAFYHVEADVRGKVLSLTGKLPSQHLRDRAETIAGLAAPNLLLDNQIIVVDKPADLLQVKAEVEQAIEILNQIDGISISAQFDRGNVVLQGTSIQHITIKNITQVIAKIPGVRQVDNQIKIQPVSIPTRIYFQQNSAEVLEIDLEGKIDKIKQLIQRYPQLKLRIIGYSHRTEVSSEILALKRSQAVETFLEDRGIDRRRIEAVGGQGNPPEIADNQERWLSRCVVFEIIQSELDGAEK